MKKNQKLIHELILNFCQNNQSMADELLSNSLLLQYIEKKTSAIDKGSKSRFSFASLYAIYVTTENYISVKNQGLDYSKFEGIKYTALMSRTHQLPFGSKIQNHALNHRCNQEFKKFFPNQNLVPIIRNTSTKRYWIEEKLLNISCNSLIINISTLIINIIDRYIYEVSINFKHLLDDIQLLEEAYLRNGDENIIINFIRSQLNPTVDARTFELVSFVILKYYYKTQTIYFGFDKNNINPVTLELYKTGRTNANDGGIDYILQPIGKIFQVTEDLSFKKFFLDIGKLNYYPITFVIKTTETKENIINIIKQSALSQYSNLQLVNEYLKCFEEIITINELLDCLHYVITNGSLPELLTELIKQTKFEFKIENNI